tara:strand:+ start:242 stop:454 length:213 start_codon:yes stop_codon:yes gene_type:complete
MIDIDTYENMTWETPSNELEDAVENLLAEVKRLSEENKKQHNVLTTLDEMIQRGESHIEMMKVLEELLCF